jgi:tetratricopeptide (TPR) repeat protein
MAEAEASTGASSRWDNLNALHFLGLLCHQQGRKTEAAELIERIIALDPQNADAHNNLGNILEGLGKGPEAESCYRRAIALRPGHAPAHNNLGVVLMAQKRVAEAVGAYRRAVALDPDSADFRYNLGNALRKSGERRQWRPTGVPQAEAQHRGVAGAARIPPGRPPRGGRRGVEELLRRIRATRLSSTCGRVPGPRAGPDAYVQQIFDDMAESFDAHLVERLRLSRAKPALRRPCRGAPPPLPRYPGCGCGTGMCALLSGCTPAPHRS